MPVLIHPLCGNLFIDPNEFQKYEPSKDVELTHHFQQLQPGGSSIRR